MTAPAFRLDMPFKGPTNAGEFGAVYFTEMARTAPKDPAVQTAAAEGVPWLTWLGQAAPFFTQDPLLAMAWVKCAMDSKARVDFIAALQQLHGVIEAPSEVT